MKVELGRAERAFWVVLFTAVAAHLLAYALVAYPALPQTVPTHWAPTVRSTAGATRRARSSWRPCRSSSRSSCSPCRASTPRGRNFERFRGVYLGMSAALTPLHGGRFVDDAAHRLWPHTRGGLARLDDNPLRARRPHDRARQLPAARATQLHLWHPHALDARERGHWRRTHRFAGPVFVAAGVVMLVAAALSTVAPDVSFWAGMAAVLVSTLVVGAYSFVIWRRAER